MTDHFGHLMAHIFTLWDVVRGSGAVARSGLVSVASFYWAIVSLASAGEGWRKGEGEGRRGAAL